MDALVLSLVHSGSRSWPGKGKQIFWHSGDRRQEDCCKFEASLVYMVNCRSVRATWQDLVSETKTKTKPSLHLELF